MNPALDRYVEENYDRLAEAAVNILGPEDGPDALHDQLIRMYSFDDDRISSMIESGYVAYYLIRAFVTSRNDRYNGDKGYKLNGPLRYDREPEYKYKGREIYDMDMSARRGRTYFVDSGRYYIDDDVPSLSEVLGRVKSAAYDAVSSLVKELRLNARLNKILRYETTNMDRLVYQKVVMEGHSLRGLEKATGIPRSTLFESYTRVRKALAAEEKKYREELL